MNSRGKRTDVAPNPRGAVQDDIELGRRIRVRRVEQGISQAALAKRLGVSFQQIQKYEKGVNRVNATRLVKIAQTLDVPVGFFYGGDGEGRELERLLHDNSRLGLRLIRAFGSIKSNAVRVKMLELIETYADLNK